MIPRRDTPGGRFYTVGGQQYPSVTTILSAIAKPALIAWSANVERAAVTAAAADLYEAHLTATAPVLPTRAAYLATLTARLGRERAHQKALTKAGDIGSQIHKLCEYTMRTAIGAAPGPQPVVCGAAHIAHRAFEEWARSVSLKPVLIERTVYSETHGYAGTMDLLARVDGVLTLIDFKSGRSVYPESFLQAAAYSVALEEMGYLEPLQSIVVRLPKTELDPAFEVVPVPPRAALFPVFLAAKALWQWSHDNDEKYWAGRRSA